MQSFYEIQIAPAASETTSLLSAGDIAFLIKDHKLLKNIIMSDIYSPELLKLLHDKELSCCNLECPLTTAGKPISKSGPNLSAVPEAADLLVRGGFDIAALANNHIMDQGIEALEQTILLCKKKGILTVGAGSDRREAEKPVFFKVRGTTIGFLAFGEEEFGSVDEKNPGIATLEPLRVHQIIKRTKKSCQLLIVNVHGGKEYYPLPSPRVQQWYKFIADSGASAVIGHHPHVVQPVEIYNNVPIFYSLGNFFFPTDTIQYKCWFRGMLAELVIAKDKICSVRMYLVRQSIENNKRIVELESPAQIEAFKIRFKQLLKIIENPLLLEQYWKCFCYYKRNSYIYSIKSAIASLGSQWVMPIKSAVKCGDVSYMGQLISDLFHLAERKKTYKTHVNSLKNLFVCPSHYEVLSTIMEMNISKDKTPDSKSWMDFTVLMQDCMAKAVRPQRCWQVSFEI